MKDLIESASYAEAMKSPQYKHWITVIRAEINKLTYIQAWKLVRLSKECKVIKN
jgi:hypothetical protein